MTAFHKFIVDRPFADPAAAARKLLEIAATLPVNKGRICVGAWNDAFRKAGGSIPEYVAGRDRAIADGDPDARVRRVRHDGWRLGTNRSDPA
jgi:hypothetical protein